MQRKWELVQENERLKAELAGFIGVHRHDDLLREIDALRTEIAHLDAQLNAPLVRAVLARDWEAVRAGLLEQARGATTPADLMGALRAAGVHHG